jgi:sec-independent protein translocase protein TatC
VSLIDKIFKFREKPESDESKPFLEHMEDLRWMIVRMVFTLSIAMMLSFCFRQELVRIVQHPLRTVDPHLVASLRTLGVTDSLTISIQIAFYAGIVLSFPLLLYYLAQFVLPALTKQEKKYVLPAITISFGLFLVGVMFSYFIVLPKALAFFFHDAQSLEWTPTWTVTEYFSFVTQITLAFGLSFELPVVIIVLVRLGFLSFEFLNRTRAYAVIIILVLAMVISPTPDVFTFFSLAAPMYLLYEACIWLAWLMEKRKKVS